MHAQVFFFCLTFTIENILQLQSLSFIKPLFCTAANLSGLYFPKFGISNLWELSSVLKTKLLQLFQLMGSTGEPQTLSQTTYSQLDSGLGFYEAILMYPLKQPEDSSCRYPNVFSCIFHKRCLLSSSLSGQTLCELHQRYLLSLCYQSD